MNKQKADYLLMRPHSRYPSMKDSENLRDALETLRKAGEVLSSIHFTVTLELEGEPGTSMEALIDITTKAEAWLAEWEGK